MAKRNLIAAVVDDELNERIKAAARDEKRSVSQFVRIALADRVAKPRDQQQTGAAA